MPQRPTVLLLIPHLGGGGAERVTALLTTGLSPGKYNLHLALITQRKKDLQPMPAWVAVHGLAAHRVRAAGFRLLRLVHQLKPALILSGMAHLNFLVLLLRPFFPRKTRVLIRQNGTVSAALKSGQLPFYTSFLYRFLYSRADQIICQTAAMATDLAQHSHFRDTRLAVLPNPVGVDAIRAFVPGRASRWPGPGPHLLAVGRLTHEKGFDLLLQAFSSLRAQFPHAHLTIVGVGPDGRALLALCRALGLESSVSFVGHVPQPEVYFPGASVFVLASRHEGLPNALLEAAAGGLPIVALPASAGLIDLLSGQLGVWLAAETSSEALAASMRTALRSLKTGQRFAHAWVDRFRLGPVLQRYEALIDEALQGTRR
jgi:glycosyltransferase involved in cell wall biosynthesis